MRKRLKGVAGVGAITATATLLALQPVSIGRGAPAVLLVVVGSWLFVGERLSRSQWLGVFVALAGAALLSLMQARETNVNSAAAQSKR